MYMGIILKTALFTLIGLFVTAAVVMNNSAVIRGVTRSAPASSVCKPQYGMCAASPGLNKVARGWIEDKPGVMPPALAAY
jgi:hypothetical protein